MYRICVSPKLQPFRPCVNSDDCWSGIPTFCRQSPRTRAVRSRSSAARGRTSAIASLPRSLPSGVSVRLGQKRPRYTVSGRRNSRTKQRDHGDVREAKMSGNISSWHRSCPSFCHPSLALRGCVPCGTHEPLRPAFLPLRAPHEREAAAMSFSTVRGRPPAWLNCPVHGPVCQRLFCDRTKKR